MENAVGCSVGHNNIETTGLSGYQPTDLMNEHCNKHNNSSSLFGDSHKRCFCIFEIMKSIFPLTITIFIAKKG